MDLEISGRKAAVAAASKGLGLASAAALAAEGVQVAICGRDEGRVREAAAQIGRQTVPIVAITSSGARSPIPFLAASSTARAGVTGFLKVLATEVAGKGVTVNSIQPGMHATDRLRAGGADLDQLAKRIPVGFIGSPDDFGKAVAFLCSEPARFITGTGLLVDGGALSGLT